MQTTVEELFDRRDIALEQAFLAATDGTITSPNILQRALFPLLSSQDVGLIVHTGPAAGRLEAVFVPVMTGSRNGSQLQRLFVIASDESLLDDYVYRISQYMRSLSVERGHSLTLFVEDDHPLCRQYWPDGSFVDAVCDHPLDVGIDVVIASFTRFRSLFFGSGGVHAMPGSLEGAGEVKDIDFDLRRRDLFYFDEAQSYDKDEFSGFSTLVEFLYAEDLDVVVGTSTMPAHLSDELSFLEELDVAEADYEPPRMIRYIEGATETYEVIATTIVKERYFQSSRVGVVAETSESAEKIFDALAQHYPHAVYCYRSDSLREVRQMIYAQIRELEKEGEGYLLIADGKSLANSDFDMNLLITGICAPEMLVRRAGRCNRRGDLMNGEILVLGCAGYIGRQLQSNQLSSYLDALSVVAEPTKFVARDWADMIV
jgi:CRISPR-associated endonuclease/helicase Cas3